MSRNTQAKIVIEGLKKIASQEQNESLNELRLILALERAVARLEQHPRLSEHLVFKGGFVLLKTVDTTRFTRDVDALAIGVSKSRVASMVERALKLELNDGLWFGDLNVEDLTDQGPYGGFRFNCAFQIGDPPVEAVKIKKLSRIHIDIGFGDALKKAPAKKPMLSILARGKTVSWSVYPLEYIFSEKLEALFVRGSGNSRAKDVYDMQLIFPLCDSKKLKDAITKTFVGRNTPVPESFRSRANSFDLSVLERAWQSVDLAGKPMRFEDARKNLLACLKEIDSAP